MYNLTNPTGLISGKRILLIFPPYPHFAGDFVRDPAATLSMSMVYAGELIEQGHLIKGEQNEVSYFDCQLHDIRDKKLGEYDYFGMSVMGGQNIVSAYDTFNVLVKGFGIDPSRIFLGGQGIEYLFPDEFKAIFPQANFMPRQTNEIERQTKTNPGQVDGGDRGIDIWRGDRGNGWFGGSDGFCG